MLDPLPPRSHRVPVDPGEINGTDPKMLTLAAAGDLRITLVDQLAGFGNALGVYRIAPDGSFADPRILVADTRDTAPGSEVELSAAYGVDSFAAGTRFGLFLVADGGARNPADLLASQELVFRDLRTGATGGSFTKAQHLQLVDADSGKAVAGRIYHTTDGDPADPLANPLNRGGAERTLSAWGEAPGEAWIAFEDQRDFDFDDLTIKVETLPAAIEPEPATARLVRFDGIGAGDRAGHSAAIIGDFNGDGFADIAIGAPHADVVGTDGLVRDEAGAVYLFFGTDAAIPPIVPVETLNGTNGVAILGNVAGGRFGWSLAGAGDVDGDGLADLIVGAPGTAPGSTGSAGAAIVLHGAILDAGPVIDLASATEAAALRPTTLVGAAPGDETGISVAGGGDIDGDGFADLVIGARLAEAEYARYSGGLSYVVRGQAGGLGDKVDLATLDGTDGFRIEGRAMFDQSGRTVAMLGDVNGDGFADLAVSGQDASPNGILKAGETYVIFGGAGPFPASLDPGTLDGKNGFIVEGAFAGGFSGFGLAAAGDVNGDGLADIVIGAYSAPRADLGPDGAAYVVYGSDQGFAARLSLGALDGSNGFTMRGPASGDGFGRAVAGIGDVNGDGIDDLAVGARYADRARAEGGGEAYVIFGRPDFGSALDLASLVDDAGGMLGGWRLDGHLGFSVAGGGDVDADGFADLLVGEPFDLAQVLDPNGMAGSTYLVFGEPGLGPKLPELDQLIAEQPLLA